MLHTFRLGFIALTPAHCQSVSSEKKTQLGKLNSTAKLNSNSTRIVFEGSARGLAGAGAGTGARAVGVVSGL